MSPPSRICPPPPQIPDCGLIGHRVPYSSDEPLRRAVLRDRKRYRNMAELVWADLNRERHRVSLPRAPEPMPHRCSGLRKEQFNEQSASSPA
jgi:hypothetical protein